MTQTPDDGKSNDRMNEGDPGIPHPAPDLNSISAQEAIDRGLIPDPRSVQAPPPGPAELRDAYNQGKKRGYRTYLLVGAAIAVVLVVFGIVAIALAGDEAENVLTGSDNAGAIERTFSAPDDVSDDEWMRSNEATAQTTTAGSRSGGCTSAVDLNGVSGVVTVNVGSISCEEANHVIISAHRQLGIGGGYFGTGNGTTYVCKTAATSKANLRDYYCESPMGDTQISWSTS